PNQAMGEEGCTNPAAVCIPDGAASVIFTFTGSTQCQWSYGIDWGDGSPRESFTYSGPGQHIVNHQYDEPGVYRATITGSGSPSGCVFTGNTILYEVPCSMAEEDFGALPRFEFGP